MAASPSLPTAAAIAALTSDFAWSGSSVTFSIPGPGSTWPAYGAGGEPASAGYGTLDAGQAARFRAAIAAWDEVIAIGLVETADMPTPGQIRVAATGTPFWGFAYYPGAGVGGDVWIDNEIVDQADFARGTYDYQALLHEIGHALGLKHPFEDGATLPTAFDTYRYTIMSYTTPRDLWVVSFAPRTGGGISASYDNLVLGTPGLFDILAIQDMYGRDTTTAAGNTTYVFDPDDPVIQVVHDAGGIDTFDLGGATRPSHLDLRQGAFSSVHLFTPADRIEAEVARFGEFHRGFIADIVSRPTTFGWTDNVGIAFGTLIEHARLGAGDDRAIGNEAANRLEGQGGDDWLSGLLGDDTLEGGAGQDTLAGGAGRNRLLGGADDDLYILGSVFDTVVEQAGGGTDTVLTALRVHALAPHVEVLRATAAAAVNFLGNAQANTIQGAAFADTLNGAAGDDLLYGLGDADRLLGADGNDRLVGGAGDDTLFGGNGADRLWGQAGDDMLAGDAGGDILLGGEGGDRLLGLAGNDLLRGEAGNDVLNGGTGLDTLEGGAGIDMMAGGAGADLFRFLLPGEGRDAIFDFTPAEGDRIGLSAVGFGFAPGSTLLDGRDLIAGAAPTAAVAGASLLYDTATGILWHDLDGTGDGGAVALALLTTRPALTATDVVLI